MAAYYHIGIKMPDGVDFRQVQEAIDSKSLDWVRYSPNSYIVWMEVPPAEMCGALLSVSGMNTGYFLVIKLDMSDGFGWLPSWVWEWLHKDRSDLPPSAAPFIRPALPSTK